MELREEPPKGYLEMKETRMLVNGIPTIETTFGEEEPISETEKASKFSLAHLEAGGIDLTSRSEMPHFYRFDITSNNTKEALEATKDYLDYLQAEATAEAERENPKTPKEVLKGE